MLPLRQLNTWGLCACAKSPAASGTATGRSTEGEHFETEGQLPHSGAIAGREPAKQIVVALLTSLKSPMGLESGHCLGRMERRWKKGIGGGGRRERKTTLKTIELK